MRALKYFKSLFTSLILSLLFLSSLGNAQSPRQTPALTPISIDEMSQTYGFYIGQSLSVKRLNTEFPELSSQLNLAQLKFDHKFKPAIDNIDSIFTQENPNWGIHKNRIIESINNEVLSIEVTYEMALDFIDLILERSEGVIPSPFIENLLIYHPTFFKNPAEEFIRGYRERFSSKGHPKSKGIHFQIEYPLSWEIKEGVRPNIVSVINSENGRGSESIMLITRDLDISEAEAAILSELEINELFDDMDMSEMFPNAKIISVDRIKLDGSHGILTVADVYQRQLDMDFVMRAQSYFILHKNKLILILCSISMLKSEEIYLETEFNKFTLLFNLVANSFVIMDKW